MFLDPWFWHLFIYNFALIRIKLPFYSLEVPRALFLAIADCDIIKFYASSHPPINSADSFSYNFLPAFLICDIINNMRSSLKFSDMRHDQVLNSFIFFPFSTVSLFFPLLGFFLSGFDILDIFSGFDISQVDYCGRLRQLIVNILRWLSRWWCCWWLWRLPSGLPTYELPTGRQSWGMQF